MQHEGKHRQMAALRTLVAEKFSAPSTAPALPRLLTGCPALDQSGGLRKGALTEMCGSVAGGQLALAALLETAVRERFFLGLIDAANAFDPAEWASEQLGRLLWVMGGGAEPSLKAADLLLRDGNLPVLLLDLQALGQRELQRVPISTWHRFHRLIASSATVFVVLTPQPLVEGVATRLALQPPATWTARLQPRGKLVGSLEARVYERGQASSPFTILAASA